MSLRWPGQRRKSWFIGAVVLIGSMTCSGTTWAWDGSDGDLWVLSWGGQDAGALQSLRGEAWLLTFNDDLAVVLLPRGRSAPPAPGVQWTQLESVRAAGRYYLYIVEDTSRARFTNARVLSRSGHTVLLWTPGEVPRLTPESVRNLQGLRQPVLITRSPKPWPVSQDLGSEKLLTEFDPLVDAMVADVTEADYVSVWQSLDDFETRYIDSAQNAAAVEWIHDVLASYGLQTEFHVYQQSGPKKNVIGTHPGLVDPSKVVYMTGHLDSISEDYNHAPGADDDATGTAAFIEAARVLSQYEFHYTIKFVGFNGEEQGLIGSQAYVEYVASQGEDVVGCYNLDMIAYRGTDPAPPDLVIYRDNASLSLAQMLHDAAIHYFPSDLEPIILNEALGASDHASFWAYGYRAILGIEEVAWGADFSPWYHSSDDRIENYPTDYPTHVTTATLAAVAQTAIPLSPDGVYLVVESWDIDDDDIGASQGNGNGVIEYGEVVELTVTLKNVGLQDAVGVEADLATSDNYADVLQEHSTYGPIPGQGGMAANVTPFVIAISTDVPDAHVIQSDLAVNEDPGNLSIELEAHAPALRVSSLVVDDVAGGDGDGIADPGEDLDLYLTIRNDGGAGVEDVIATLTSGDPYLVVDPTPHGFGDMNPGAESQGGPYPVSVDPGAPIGYQAQLVLELEGSGSYSHDHAFALNIGTIFADNMESGEGYWTHYSGTAGYGDQWHLESYRNHTPGGGFSWKCGGPGPSNYQNKLHSVLESSSFFLPAASALTFWHWMDAEILDSNEAWDGGNVEVSTDGGQTWSLIAPEGGYPYTIVPNPDSPFAPGTLVFSGSHGWKEESFDLSGYSGDSKIRFVFGTDGAVTDEGWYVDDVQVLLVPSAVAHGAERMNLELHPAFPNPTDGTTVLRLHLPKRRGVRIVVYDVLGRQVRTLASGTLNAGLHEFLWDGRDSRGRPLGSGVYWARMDAGGSSQIARVIRLD